jgi:methyl-accepting chemotaxis protein
MSNKFPRRLDRGSKGKAEKEGAMGGFTLGIRGKIWSLVGLIVVGLCLMTAQDLASMRRTLLEDRQLAMRQVVESAVSVAAGYDARAKKGEFTEEQAKLLAREALRSVRYGKNDYLFINNYNYSAIMHPLRPDMEGGDQSQLKDPNGVYITRDMVDMARRDGGGFIHYVWPRTKDAAQPSPKMSFVIDYKPWGWIVGTGLYIDDLDDMFRAKVADSVIKGLLILLAAAVAGGLIARSITRPLAVLVARMRALAAGDNTSAVAGTDRKDEVGELASAMEIFRAKAIENQNLLNEQERLKGLAADERNRTLREMASGLESRVRSAVDALGRVGERLNGASAAMSRTAEQTSEQTGAVVVATEQTTSNVQTVAAAAEELSASGNEISRQVSLSAEIAREAASEAEQTNVLVGELSAAAGRIGEVVRLIDSIAAQTNLLALNATIEAARAGEAGKGFAVVANEVKTLANQTAKATQEITAQILSVQSETDKAVVAIRHIGETINKVDEATSSIASAVEEQNAAIMEITRSVQEAARGTREVSEHITMVSEGAKASRSVADEVAGSAREMIGHNGDLNHQIETFLSEVRSQAA